MDKPRHSAADAMTRAVLAAVRCVVVLMLLVAPAYATIQEFYGEHLPRSEANSFDRCPGQLLILPKGGELLVAPPAQGDPAAACGVDLAAVPSASPYPDRLPPDGFVARFAALPHTLVDFAPAQPRAPPHA